MKFLFIKQSAFVKPLSLITFVQLVQAKLDISAIILQYFSLQPITV